MLKVGIDTISFYTSHYVLDQTELALARGTDPDKFRIGLGQHQMAVAAPDEDIVTLAANAAQQALKDIDLSSIEMLLFATESGVDQSKSAGIYVHQLLGLPERCRVLELKQACYSATGALQLALPFLKSFPDRKILLIASDIARYGLGTTGESSQGCGAVAMVLSAHPRILAIESEYGVVTEDVMDFWRPNYSDQAFVEGKYSSRLYLSMLEKTWHQYFMQSGRDFRDHQHFCYHTPVPRLVEKAHRVLAKINHYPDADTEETVQRSLTYARQIGNSYTASLYLALIALLDFSDKDLTNQRVGFYSYGSGCVAEFFSGVIQPGYQKVLHKEAHAKILAERVSLSVAEYENFYSFELPQDGSECLLPQYTRGAFRLAGIREHKRIYAHVSQHIDYVDFSESVSVANDA
ncbi:MAG: hydroxymethylglutaryl-CoA synthase [Gammaproteobacteria bacterium]|nr:hydroxymethylglutaryl-CoA synthase [Gammaproteobacteria bacterium]